jgi:hypothetical protein
MSVPNVKPKYDEKEEARMQALMGALRDQTSQVISGEENQTRTLEEVGGGLLADGSGLDLKSIPTVYFKNVKGGVYTINHRTSKLFVEGCEDLTVIVNNNIMTATVEAWRCKNLTLRASTNIKTVQLDLSENAKLEFAEPQNFSCLVYQGVKGDIDIEFKSEPNFNMSTSFEKVLQRFPDSNFDIDQFIIRFVDEIGPGLTEERCIRLKNGFLSTEREAADWEKRNELAKARYMENFLKESGINLNKDENKKIQPNATCPLCDSGKKFKKCCMNKKSLTGVEKPATYKDEAKR